MEHESILTIVSKSIDDIRDAFNVLIKDNRKLTAYVWRAIRSYDEPDKSYFFLDTDRIPFWVPDEKTMSQIAEILCDDGFGLLDIYNSVSPDYHDYILTTPYGSCESGYNEEDFKNEMDSLEENYEEELINIYRKSVKGYKEFWTKDSQQEPPMPVKGTAPKTTEQIMEESYLSRTSEQSIEEYKSMLNSKKDLNALYEKFQKQFAALKSNNEWIEGLSRYFILNGKPPYDNSLYKEISFGTQLAQAEQFRFQGKIFHIHGTSVSIQYNSKMIDPQIKELLCAAEDDLRLAIVRRGGVIDVVSHEKDYTVKYADCCVMLDNEEIRGDWYKSDCFSGNIKKFGLELIGRIAIWYAIIRTSELTRDELQSLQNGSFYLDTIEAKYNKVSEKEEQLRIEEQIQEEKVFSEIVQMIKGKYSTGKAPSYAQIKLDISLNSFSNTSCSWLSNWKGVENYIKEKYNVTAAAYFKKLFINGQVAEKQQREEQKRKAEEERAVRKQEKQREEEEKQRIKNEKAQEKAEQERLAAEAKAKKAAALQEARANANVLYAPGEEPEKLHNRIVTLMAKLEEAYPDHVISGLNKHHKKWGETVTGLYRKLGYADSHSFLEAYGFQIRDAKGGRPLELDPNAVIEELKRRYPDGTKQMISELMAENKDLPLKTLANSAKELLGMGLGTYLKSIGILK